MRFLLEDVMLYPKNTFTAGNPDPVVYYQDALELVEIDSISTFYTNYYSSTKKEYWPQSYYDLRVTMNKSGLFNAYIPPQSGEIEVAKHSCACSKIPTAATRDIRRINRDLHKLAIQSVNISIEATRYRENDDSTGNVLELLNDKLESQSLKHANIEQILPLNYTLTNDKLITPSTVALFTAKTVGMHRFSDCK